MRWNPCRRTSATCCGSRWTRRNTARSWSRRRRRWDSLISGMSDKELLHALRTLDIDDQIYLGQYLPAT